MAGRRPAYPGYNRCMSAEPLNRCPLLRPFRAVWLLVWLGGGLATLALVFPLISLRLRGRIASVWSRGLLAVFGVRLHLSGEMPRGSGLVVANHVSWLDPFLLLACFPVRFVAKDEIRSWPVFGWIAVRAGTVFIRRDLRRDVARVTRLFEARIDAGEVVALFPESTTGNGRFLRPFKTALFQVAVSRDALCMPVGIRYRQRGAEWIDDMGLGESLWRMLGLCRLDVDLLFTPAVAASGRSRRELAQSSEQAIAAALSQEVLRNPPDISAGLPDAMP